MQRPLPHKETLAKRRESYNKQTAKDFRKEKKIQGQLDTASSKRQKMNTHIKNLTKDFKKSEAASVIHFAKAEATEDQLHLKI